MTICGCEWAQRVILGAKSANKCKGHEQVQVGTKGTRGMKSKGGHEQVKVGMKRTKGYAEQEWVWLGGERSDRKQVSKTRCKWAQKAKQGQRMQVGAKGTSDRQTHLPPRVRAA